MLLTVCTFQLYSKHCVYWKTCAITKATAASGARRSGCDVSLRHHVAVCVQTLSGVALVSVCFRGAARVTELLLLRLTK